MRVNINILLIVYYFIIIKTRIWWLISLYCSNRFIYFLFPRLVWKTKKVSDETDKNLFSYFHKIFFIWKQLARLKRSSINFDSCSNLNDTLLVLLKKEEDLLTIPVVSFVLVYSRSCRYHYIWKRCGAALYEL